jgi:hypothetical protein
VCNPSGSAFGPCDCGIEPVDSRAIEEEPITHPDVSVSPTDGGDETGDGAPSSTAILKGAIQKGPFLLGSSVTLSGIDKSGIPTGQAFTTQTTTNLGDFEVTFGYRGNVDIQAQGFYYDEIAGALSSAPITLRALYNVKMVGNRGRTSM